MLTLQQIYNEYPGLPQASSHRRDVLVEYIQHELLDSIFKQKAAVHLSFIGGTAIRIVYGSERFSEDLDFDNFGLSFEEFQQLLDSVVVDMRAKLFEVEYRFVEKGAYHCYVRFPHQLQTNNLSPLVHEKILIRVDAMRKQKLREPKIFELNKFNRFRPIQVNSIDVILAQKLIAIKERHREKGRDLYDVHFLYGKTSPDEVYLAEMTGMTVPEFYAATYARCTTFNIDDLAADVLPLLVDAGQVERVRRFMPLIEQKWQLQKEVV